MVASHMLTSLLHLQESKPGSSPKTRRNTPQGYQNTSAGILPDLSKSPRVDSGHAVSWVPSCAHPRVETPPYGGLCLRYSGVSYCPGCVMPSSVSNLRLLPWSLGKAALQEVPTAQAKRWKLQKMVGNHVASETWATQCKDF